MKILLVILLIISVTGCSKQKEQVVDGEKKVQVFLNDREFLVPKKYINKPSRAVTSPLMFEGSQGMISYFYWPSLQGLVATDEQQNFGQFNQQVVSMTWRILSENYISAKQYGVNIREDNNRILNTKCKWKEIICFNIKDQNFYKWIGTINNIGSFYIRCPKEIESTELLENGICNLDFDYDQKDLYIETLISSNFIKSDEDLPNVIYQMKVFLDEWEVR